MEGWIISIAGVLIFIILMVCGMRIGIAGAIAGLLMIVVVYGDLDIAGKNIIPLIFGQSASYMLTIIPLFLLMGYIALAYGIGTDIFYTVRCWLGSLPGGLAVATTFGTAFFGAISGASPVSVTLFGKLAVPEMEKAGYNWKLAVGSVLGAGGLDELIPPSTLLVMYAILAQESAGRLLIAGVIPGILSAVLLSLMIILRCVLNPKLGPPEPPTTFRVKIISLKHAVVGLIVMIIIIGGIISGIFTPTEAAAWSVLAMLVAGFISQRGFQWAKLKDGVISTAKTTAMIFMIIIGIKVMSTGIIATGSMNDMVDFFTSLSVSPYILLLGASIIYFILGCFVGVMAMLVMTVPFFVPVFSAIGFDPVWFGVIIVILCEIGLMTPPIGGNVFIISKVTGRELAECFSTVWWFVGINFVVLIILTIFPEIVLFLPNLI